MANHHKRRKGIPDRWEEYLSIGKPLPKTRFIAFKVPLKQSLSAKVENAEKFSPDSLMQLSVAGSWSLGLVIDLTNTTRYYDPQEILDKGVEYQKIFTEGHVTPSKNVVMQFVSVVDDFLERNLDNEKLIGVHCTHGVNRTGYLVCRYMIDRLAFPPDEAIESYGECRGYEIERENYLEDLRSGVRIEKEAYEEYKAENPVKPYSPPPTKSGRRQRHRKGPYPEQNGRGHDSGSDQTAEANCRSGIDHVETVQDNSDPVFGEYERRDYVPVISGSDRRNWVGDNCHNPYQRGAPYSYRGNHSNHRRGRQLRSNQQGEATADFNADTVSNGPRNRSNGNYHAGRGYGNYEYQCNSNAYGNYGYGNYGYQGNGNVYGNYGYGNYGYNHRVSGYYGQQHDSDDYGSFGRSHTERYNRIQSDP